MFACRPRTGKVTSPEMRDEDARSQAKPMLTPEMERAVRAEVRARLRVWGIAAILVLLVVLSVLAYFVQELRAR